MRNITVAKIVSFYVRLSCTRLAGDKTNVGTKPTHGRRRVRRGSDGGAREFHFIIVTLNSNFLTKTFSAYKQTGKKKFMTNIVIIILLREMGKGHWNWNEIENCKQKLKKTQNAIWIMRIRNRWLFYIETECTRRLQRFITVWIIQYGPYESYCISFLCDALFERVSRRLDTRVLLQNL